MAVPLIRPSATFSPREKAMGGIDIAVDFTL